MKDCPNCGGTGIDSMDGGQCHYCDGTGTIGYDDYDNYDDVDYNDDDWENDDDEEFE